MKQQNFQCGSSSSRRSSVEDATSRVLAQTQLFKNSSVSLVKVTNRKKVTANVMRIQKAK